MTIILSDVQFVGILLSTLSAGILIGALTAFYTAHKDKENQS